MKAAFIVVTTNKDSVSVLTYVAPGQFGPDIHPGDPGCTTPSENLIRETWITRDADCNFSTCEGNCYGQHNLPTHSVLIAAVIFAD